MESRYINRYNTFCKCLKNLEKSRTADPRADFVLEATVLNFSLAFDISWKVMKDILVQQYAIADFVAGSPREVLRRSFQAELIADDVWMEMLSVRNRLIHDYDGDIIKQYCDKIVAVYIDIFYQFYHTAARLIQHFQSDDLL